MLKTSTKKKISETLRKNDKIRGPNSHHWKGNSASYSSIHKWIRKWHGNAQRCDNREFAIFG